MPTKTMQPEQMDLSVSSRHRNCQGCFLSWVCTVAVTWCLFYTSLLASSLQTVLSFRCLSHRDSLLPLGSTGIETSLSSFGGRSQLCRQKKEESGAENLTNPISFPSRIRYLLTFRACTGENVFLLAVFPADPCCSWSG